MKIRDIELFQVEIPPIPVIAKVAPRIFDLTLCRVHTDEGLTGLGEAHGFPPQFAQAAEQLIDQDPLGIAPFTLEDPFECALLDLTAQAAGLPLYRFFGERQRDRIPVSYWSRPMEPKETAAEAEVGARLGFTNHKLKARPWNVVETAQAIRDAVGSDYTIGLDPNQKFRHVHVAARLARSST